MKCEYIDTDAALKAWLDSLKSRKVERVGVDIEGEFNLHCYGEHLCLVQVFDGRDYALIDPFKVRITLIRDFFENETIAKIMYDCTGDRTLLYRKYGIDVKNIEDLFPAAELLDLEKRNLGFVLTRFLGVEPKAKKKFQQHNWMRRPIQKEALDYALEDVRYLFDLKTALLKELASLDLLDEYEKNNRAVQEKPVNMNPVPGVFRKNRFKKMPSRARDLFTKIFEMRDGYAELLDLPPNTVLSNENVFALSQGQISVGRLRFPHRVSRDIRARICRELEDLLKNDNYY